MVQQFLTYAIQFVLWSFAAHTTIYFFSGLMSRRRRVSPGQLSLLDEQLQPIWAECAADDGQWLDEIQQAQPIALSTATPSDEWQWIEAATADDAALVDRFTQFIQQYWAITPVHNVVPFIRPTKRTAQAIDWNNLSPYQLRSECQKKGIRWRNAHGKNRHLSKSEMVQALSQIAAA